VPRVEIRVGGEAGEPGYALRELGRNVAEIGPRFRQMHQDERAAKERERQFQIQEQRAQASLAREQNLAAARAEKAQEQEEGREALKATIQEQSDKALGVAHQEQVRRALESPEGLLGPFGMASALAKGAPNTMRVKERWAGYKELASRMDPSHGRTWLNDTLKRDAAEEKQRVIAEGYAEEAQALDVAIKEGKFDDPFGPVSKEGEPSEEGGALAQQLAKALQDGLAARKPPGAVHKALALVHAKHAKLSARKAGWEAADLRVKEMLDQMRVLANNAPDGVDPDTGKSIRGELIERAHAAEGEWQRTIGLPGVSESYRRATDPAKDVGEITKLLFGAQTEASPDAVLQEMNAAAEAKGPAQQAEDMALATGAGPARKSSRTAQAAPGAKGAAGGSVPRGTPTRAPEGGKQAGQIRSIVQEEVAGALAGGSKNSRATAIKGLLDRLEHDLGLDMSDQGVRAAVREAISQAVGARP